MEVQNIYTCVGCCGPAFSVYVSSVMQNIIDLKIIRVTSTRLQNCESENTTKSNNAR
jgi:hypothetical protein